MRDCAPVVRTADASWRLLLSQSSNAFSLFAGNSSLHTPPQSHTAFRKIIHSQHKNAEAGCQENPTQVRMQKKNNLLAYRSLSNSHKSAVWKDLWKIIFPCEFASPVTHPAIFATGQDALALCESCTYRKKRLSKQLTSETAGEGSRTRAACTLLWHHVDATS